MYYLVVSKLYKAGDVYWKLCNCEIIEIIDWNKIDLSNNLIVIEKSSQMKNSLNGLLKI